MSRLLLFILSLAVILSAAPGSYAVVVHARRHHNRSLKVSNSSLSEEALVPQYIGNVSRRACRVKPTSSVSSTAIVSSSSLSTLTSPVPATTSSSIIALTAAPTNANILVTSVPSETTALSTPVSTSALPPSTTQDEEVAATTASSNTQSQSSPTGTSSQSDIDEYLSDQNTVRAQHGATPLTWNYTLAAAAQEWADGCVFDHSGGTLGPYGENLAAGTGSSYGISAAISSWTNEVSEYDPNDPVASHFTQVVWKATTEVGCAVQECNGIFPASYGEAQYYVCEYFPQGNVEGEFSENVQV